MQNSDYLLKSFLNAAGVFIYVSLVAWFLFNGEGVFGEVESFLLPVMMLMLFVISACITGLLVLGKPIHLYLNNKKREAIMNIIDNAIKYTNAGTVQILEDIVERDGATWLRFSVKDPGIGFSAEERARLFTKFQRTETARRSDPNGMGLGIYFVRRVIEDHGGKIWAESERIGKGSRFTFEIPQRSAW